MKLNVFNRKGEETGRTVELSDAVFGIEPNDHAIYLDVKQYMANNRQGTHKSKKKSEVSENTRKLIRQKGSGGARRGDINSPVLSAGGADSGIELAAEKLLFCLRIAGEIKNLLNVRDHCLAAARTLRNGLSHS